MKTTGILVASFFCLTLGAPAAWAQSDGDGDEVELGDEPLATDDSGTLGGASENPTAPKSSAEEPAPEKVQAGRADDGYPISLADRPLTLHSGMSQVGIAAGAVFDPVTLFGVLQADYGVTEKVQIGLRYSPGALVDGSFETGKAVGVEAHYQLKSWLAAQLAVPVLLDPFGIALVAGAPMKFRFAKFALFFGEDLLSIKLYRLIPSVENAAETAAQVALDATNTETADAELRTIGGVIYQIDPRLAFTARAGIGFKINASNAENTRRLLTNLRLTWVKGKRIDLGAELVVGDFNDFAKTAGLQVFAKLRI